MKFDYSLPFINSGNPVNSSSIGSISLSTSGQKEINTNLWCFSLLNINFTGDAPNMTTRNVLDSTFKTIIQNLHAKALQYSGGATTNIYQVTVGKTNYLLGGGYLCSDCSFGDGQCCPTTPFTQDFFLVNVELCKELGIGMDISANVQLPYVTWQAQIAWQISYMAGQGVVVKQILFGQENVTSAYDVYWLGHSALNNTDFTNKAIDYTTKVNPELIALKAANPDKNFYLDSALIEETGTREVLWSAQMGGFTNDGFRQYFNLNNLLAGTSQSLTTDWEQNLSTINTLVFTTAIARLNSFKTKYPTQKMGVYQWGLRNPNVTPTLENTVLGMLFQAKMTKMMLDYNYANNDLISYASYQDLKQFINNDNTVQMFGQSLMLIGQLFIGTTIQYIPITFDLGDGIDGVACYDGTNYRILVWNDTATPKSDQNKITINGISSDSWTIESYYGNSLDTTTISHSISIATSVFIPAFSINIITI